MLRDGGQVSLFKHAPTLAVSSKPSSELASPSILVAMAASNSRVIFVVATTTMLLFSSFLLPHSNSKSKSKSPKPPKHHHKPPTTESPVIGKPPYVRPPIIGKPHIVVPPVIGSPPITVPPVGGSTPCSPPALAPASPPPALAPASSPPALAPASPPPALAPASSPPALAPASCPADSLMMGACVDLLGGLVHIGLGDPVANQCCPPLLRLVELEAAVCLCTTIKLKHLDISVYFPLALQLLLTCGKAPPPGYTCTLYAHATPSLNVHSHPTAWNRLF
ncbi:uncharacterized protein LOC141823424 [Curcuma longa]|uniref:uncharacterized protein LOC141823424 n=1 Tax=Curcuma longa TaxID=136217 RepID=UPI003D9E3D5E